VIYLKRIWDFVIAVAGLIIFAPFMLILAALVLLTLGRPVFFVQRRLGQSGSGIDLFKFRTMTNARDSSGNLLPDGERTPPFGKVVRRFRLDELPSLINVIKGDISMVGPRPLPAQSEANILGGAARLAVRPGFTGLAQISGNTRLTHSEKVAIDLLYIRNWSVVLDMKILIRTLRTVVVGEARDETLIEQALSYVAARDLE
jgi:lipopolysaccharide/colanic/teichoic acid biosynthesis glycosyltransferase